jgi:hypothetical protein
MIRLIEVTAKRPTISEPIRAIRREEIGVEEGDEKELNIVWADLILEGMREAGCLPA